MNIGDIVRSNDIVSITINRGRNSERTYNFVFSNGGDAFGAFGRIKRERNDTHSTFIFLDKQRKIEEEAELNAVIDKLMGEEQ